MSESARIIFILDGQRKSAFSLRGGSPLKMGAKILDFLRSRPEEEQKETIRNLELSESKERSSSIFMSEQTDWKKILKEKNTAELLNLFHEESLNESRQYPDFTYTINYDDRELGFGISAAPETVFSFEELDETALEVMQEEYEQDIWEEFIDDIEPAIVDDVISFEEQAYIKYKQEFPVVSKRLKEAGYTFDSENGVWSKKSDDVNREVKTLMSYFGPEETIDWLEEEE